jgi:hypothetical protein
MCFSATSSGYNFLIGLVGSFLLAKYGSPKYSENNLIYGYFFFYIILMQLFDLIFWLNQNPSSKINSIFTYIAAAVVYTQPTMLYLLKILIKKPKFDNNTDKFYLIANIIYLFVVLAYYISFTKDKPIITLKKGNHLKWKWTDHANFMYFILFILNIFYLSNIKYSIMIFLFIFGSLLVSYKLFYNYVGEIWCYLAALAPICILVCTYLL